MDFIERWFHISPDGGNGTLEVLYIGGIILLIFAILRTLRSHVISFFSWCLEQLGQRKSGDRFDS